MDVRHTSWGSDARQMCVGAALCSVSIAHVLYTLSLEHVPATRVRYDHSLLETWLAYSMGAIFLVDLGNKNVAATTAPAPMAMLRGVMAGMFEVTVVVSVNVDTRYREIQYRSREMNGFGIDGQVVL